MDQIWPMGCGVLIWEVYTAANTNGPKMYVWSCPSPAGKSSMAPHFPQGEERNLWLSFMAFAHSVPSLCFWSRVLPSLSRYDHIDE